MADYMKVEEEARKKRVRTASVRTYYENGLRIIWIIKVVQIKVVQIIWALYKEYIIFIL